VFAQDSIAFGKAFKLTLGMKLEDDPYSSGVTPLPSARLSWNLSDRALLWSAVSRAVRSPTPFDRDVVEKIGSLVFLTGGPEFTSEKVTAYEAGYRGQPTARTSLSISTFYQVYNDLRSVEITPVTFLPLQWGNGMKGNTYGAEVWGSYQVRDWWRLAAGFNTLHENLSFKAGSAGSLGLAGFPGIEQAGSDPARQASLRSSINLHANFTLDANLRYVGARPDPATPSYHELDASAVWKPSRPLEISLTGFNLLHARHVEYAATPTSIEVPRSVWIEAHWRH
jgi:iron complex outermembrane receptor protein